MSIKLYTYLGYSAPWRPAIALKLKKIPFTQISIDLKNKEQFSKQYTKINPNMTVPALQVGECIIQETMAIIQYLEDTNPTPSLLPKDPYQRAQIRALCETVNSGIHPYHASRLYEWFKQQGIEQESFDKKDISGLLLDRGFKALDQMLSQTMGKYSFGNNLTLADIFIYPTVYGQDVSDLINVDNYPNIKQVVCNLSQLPEFKSEQ